VLWCGLPLDVGTRVGYLCGCNIYGVSRRQEISVFSLVLVFRSVHLPCWFVHADLRESVLNMIVFFVCVCACLHIISDGAGAGAGAESNDSCRNGRAWYARSKSGYVKIHGRWHGDRRRRRWC